MRNLSLYALLALLMLAAPMPSSAAAAPTIDNIRAAWDKQNTGVIAVRYAQDNSGIGGGTAGNTSGGSKSLLETTYIRIPQMLYRNHWFSGIEQSAERVGITSLGEGRSLSICTQNGWPVVSKGQPVGLSAAGDKTGSITPAAETERCWSEGNMETILYSMYRRDDDPNTQWLYGWLKYATVGESGENVGGYECWKLDVTDTGDHNIAKRYQIWVDPAIGYCPRGIVKEGAAGGAFGSGPGSFKTVVDFSEYIETSKGIWFPGKIVDVHNQANANCVNRVIVWRLKEVLKDRPCSKDALTIKFATGTTVYRDLPKADKKPGPSEREALTAAADGSLIPYDGAKAAEGTTGVREQMVEVKAEIHRVDAAQVRNIGVDRVLNEQSCVNLSDASMLTKLRQAARPVSASVVTMRNNVSAKIELTSDYETVRMTVLPRVYADKTAAMEVEARCKPANSDAPMKKGYRTMATLRAADGEGALVTGSAQGKSGDVELVILTARAVSRP